MSTVLEIERAISAVSPKELDDLYTWMDQTIDVRLKADLDAGRIDDRIGGALADHMAGAPAARERIPGAKARICGSYCPD